jgi:hypothetical protein
MRIRGPAVPVLRWHGPVARAVDFAVNGQWMGFGVGAQLLIYL